MTIGESGRVDRGEALLSEWRGAMKGYYRRSSSQDSKVIIVQRLEGRLPEKWSKALGIVAKFKASPAEGFLEETRDGRQPGQK